jgi:integrase/recombinase XerC/integrase/recombinase XerD
MREAVNRWLKESGVKGDRDRRLTPFSLRHTAGVMMVDNGATIEEIMERMRIEWKPTAQIYFRLRGSLGTVGPDSTDRAEKTDKPDTT